MGELIDLKAGDTAYLVSGARHRAQPAAVIIQKVSRTHIHTVRCKFLRDTGWQTGTQYAPDRLYASLAEIETEKRISAKHRELERLVDSSRASDFSEDELDALIEQFNKKRAPLFNASTPNKE